VKKSQVVAGYFPNGIPYNRVGHGSRPLIIFQGLVFFENKPLPARMIWLYARYYQYLEEDYTTYLVLPKAGLPDGYSMQNMADDYATMIRDEFGEPLDVIGVSTGGSIAQYFAADHPKLVRKLVIHSSAYTLSDATRRAQMQAGHLARQHKWRAAYAAMLSPVNATGPVARLGMFLMQVLLTGMFGVPKGASDFVATIEAEDKHNFKERLGQITAPTLVVAGDQDPFYPVDLFRETADGIPNARLILYKGMGHPASGKQFRRDVLRFLKE
jgi:pimeloyl-ACP methyl ester carboxylesterase